MIVLATPKGWTGPEIVDGQQIEGTFRAHQVPLSDPGDLPAHLRTARGVDEELSARGAVRRERDAPAGARRAGADGAIAAWERTRTRMAGCCLRDLRLPDFREYAVDVTAPGQARRRGHARARTLPARRHRALTANSATSGCSVPTKRYRTDCEAVFEATGRQWDAQTEPDDEWLSPDGRVLEMLSEHQCQGWLEGYLLTGRHGVFNSYEAFIHIVDSMFNQHAKWLKITRSLPWRRPIASLNYLLASHVWRQDHNGFTHQDPGLHRSRGEQEGRSRPGLPAARRELPAVSVMDHCLRSRQLRQRRRRGQASSSSVARLSIAPCGIAPTALASGTGPAMTMAAEPDVVMAAAGDVPTLETLAAVALLRQHLPALRIRVVNVVDLMKLQPAQRASARAAG